MSFKCIINSVFHFQPSTLISYNSIKTIIHRKRVIVMLRFVLTYQRSTRRSLLSTDVIQHISRINGWLHYNNLLSPELALMKVCNCYGYTK